MSGVMEAGMDGGKEAQPILRRTSPVGENRFLHV